MYPNLNLAGLEKKLFEPFYPKYVSFKELKKENTSVIWFPFNLLYFPIVCFGKIGKKADLILDSTFEEAYDEFPFFSRIKKYFMPTEVPPEYACKKGYDPLWHNRQLLENFTFNINEILEKKDIELRDFGDDIVLFAGKQPVSRRDNVYDNDAIRAETRALQVKVDLDLKSLDKITVSEGLGKVEEAFENIKELYKEYQKLMEKYTKNTSNKFVLEIDNFYSHRKPI